jgi:hypothetical protein
MDRRVLAFAATRPRGRAWAAAWSAHTAIADRGAAWNKPDDVSDGMARPRHRHAGLRWINEGAGPYA